MCVCQRYLVMVSQRVLLLFVSPSVCVYARLYVVCLQYDTRQTEQNCGNGDLPRVGHLS